MKLTREAIQRMISQKQGTTTVTVINQEGGGGGGGVTLGPLLTSLNAESMPSAEGYLHWTGSAWAFDTPTGGDPVDLTPYALKTWVQTNYASKDDIADFITKDEADTYYAALSHTHANYLPLTAGSSKPLTGSLYFSGNSGINWAGGVGMLACMPESGWTGISSSQWGVGALSAQGVIRSNANDILHYRNGTNYKIWDAYNFTPSDYLPLTGGTVESLTVTNGLDADSITVGSIVNSDTLAEYLDADAMQTWGDGRYLKLADKAGLFTQLANYDGALQITIGGTQKSLTIAYANAAGSANTAVNADKLDNHHAADFALASSLGNYLPLTGGTLTGNLIMNDAGVGFGPNGNYGYIDYSNSQLRIGSGTVHVQSDGVFLFNGDQVATQPWVTARLGNYLPLTGGTVNGNLNVKGTIQAQDSNGNNKVIIYGTTGNIRAEKVYIGGSTSGYEAATHNWVTAQGYQANVIETVKVAGTALTPTNKTVDIPAATSDGSIFGVVAIGTGFTFDEDRLCVSEAPITMGFKRLNKSTSETWDADTMTVNGTQYALLTNYRATSEWANMPAGMSWGGVLQITAGSGVGYLSGQLAWDSNHNVTTGVTRKLYWRSRNSTGWGTDDWHTIAFEDWVTSQVGNYLPLTGGTLTNSLFIARSDSSVGKVSAANTNGTIELLTYSNRGVYDRTADHWLIGTDGTYTFLLDGNVGIGTTTPGYKLDVNGNTRVSGDIYMTGALNFADGNFPVEILHGASGDANYAIAQFGLRPQVLTGTNTYTNVALISDLSGYLKLTGGKLSSSSHQTLTISSSLEESGAANWVGIQFGHDSGDTYTRYGGIRMDEQNGYLIRYNSAYTLYTIWDSGNFNPSNYLPLAGYTMDSNAAIRFRGTENNGVYIDKDGIAWHEGSWNAPAIDITYDPVKDVGDATFAGSLTVRGTVNGVKLNQFKATYPSDVQGNTSGYELIGQVTHNTSYSRTWLTLSVASRHNGSQIVNIICGCEQPTASFDIAHAFCEISQFGTMENSTDVDVLYAYAKQEGTSITWSFFWHNRDTSPADINLIASGGSASIDLYNRAWMTGISSSTYGTLMARGQRRIGLTSSYITSNVQGLTSYWAKIWDISLTTQQNKEKTMIFDIEKYDNNTFYGTAILWLKQNGGNGSSNYNISAKLDMMNGNIPAEDFKLYINNTTGKCELWCNIRSVNKYYNFTVLKRTSGAAANDAGVLGMWYSVNIQQAQTPPSSAYTAVNATYRYGDLHAGNTVVDGQLAVYDTAVVQADVMVGDSLYFGNDYNAPRLYIDNGHLYFNGTRIA